MSRAEKFIKGWCPTAFQPMPAGDGLILRVRPRLGVFSYPQLLTLARIAALFGDGNLYLTERANVQIRGIQKENHPEILKELAAVSLIEKNQKAEAVRNLVICPAIALHAKEKVHAVAVALEKLLLKNPAFHELPVKFGFAIASGDRIDLSSVSDISFIGRGDRIFLLLDGGLEKAVELRGRDEAVAAVARILEAFLALREKNKAIRRMRDAIAEAGLDFLLGVTGLAPASNAMPLVRAPAPVGYREDLKAVGIGFVFGEVGQSALAAILKLMADEHVPAVAVSARRALVFPAATKEVAGRLLDLGREADGIIDPEDVALRVHACAGAPGCLRGTTYTRRDGQNLIAALREYARDPEEIQIFGCEKRCSSSEAEVTAVAKNGRYMLVGPSGATVGTGITSAELPASILAYLGDDE